MAYYQAPWEYEGELPQYRLNTQTSMPQAAPAHDGTAAASMAPAGGAAGSPYMAAAGLGLQGVGTALNAYGAYKQSEQADKEFELQKENFEFQKALSMQDRERQEEERQRRALLEGGQYAGNYLDKSIDRYGRYNAMTGA